MLGLAKFNLWMLNLCQVTSACTIPTTFHFNLEIFSCALKPQCLRASASVPPPLRRYHLLMHWRCCLSPFCKFFFFFFIYFLFFTEQNATTPVPPRPLHRARHINRSWSHYPCHLLAASTHSTSPFISFFSFIYLLFFANSFCPFFLNTTACLPLLAVSTPAFFDAPWFLNVPTPIPSTPSLLAPQRPLAPQRTRSHFRGDPSPGFSPCPFDDPTPGSSMRAWLLNTPSPGPSMPRPPVPQRPIPRFLDIHDRDSQNCL